MYNRGRYKQNIGRQHLSSSHLGMVTHFVLLFCVLMAFSSSSSCPVFFSFFTRLFTAFSHHFSSWPPPFCSPTPPIPPPAPPLPAGVFFHPRRSMHCREYPLLINQPGICRRSNSSFGVDSPMLLMAIKSQVGNFENRQAIRETWGRSGLVRGGSNKKFRLVRTVFLLGRQDSSTGPHPDLKNLLELENQKYGDILQWDFRDTFFNLTLKDLLFWHWFQQYCPTAAFVFKGDDDVFVRTDHNLWKPYTNETNIDLFVGDVINNAQPNREPSTKYYIPESFYKGAYPPYAGGGGVVYSGSLALRLKEVSERVRLFPIDDVYLGMCMHRLGLSPRHHPGFLTFDLPHSDRSNYCAYKSVLLVHRRSPKQMLTLWTQLQGRHAPYSALCCVHPPAVISRFVH
uniref:Hexosyltransferase n=1 Tax=Stegastes partitus TaxID=144197 RepID=A0A3B5A194_9TELE